MQSEIKMSSSVPHAGRARSAGNVHRNVPGRGAQTRQGRQSSGEASRIYREQKDIEYGAPTPVNQGVVETGDGTQMPTMDAVYSFPSAEKDKFAFRDYMRRTGAFAADVPGQVTNWNIQDGDIDMMYQAYKEREQFEFELWLSKHVDIRKPHNFEWLQRLAPEYIAKRIEQFDRAQNQQRRKEFIKHFGIHTRDDLMTKYHLDRNGGMYYDPNDPVNQQTGYLPGMFAKPRQQARWSGFTSMFSGTPTGIGTPMQSYNPSGFAPWSGQANQFGGGTIAERSTPAAVKLERAGG